mmetsp:Transcript_14904/g.31625  ORF Transcript_14904/g.31625 Transcript_14904/m.31625 type:complete len:273 (-) Transcript_14904:141-959(-)
MLWKRGLKSTCTTSATLSSAASSKPKLDAQRDALSDSSPSLSRTWSPDWTRASAPMRGALLSLLLDKTAPRRSATHSPRTVHLMGDVLATASRSFDGGLADDCPAGLMMPSTIWTTMIGIPAAMAASPPGTADPMASPSAAQHAPLSASSPTSAWLRAARPQRSFSNNPNPAEKAASRGTSATILAKRYSHAPYHLRARSRPTTGASALSVLKVFIRPIIAMLIAAYERSVIRSATLPASSVVVCPKTSPRTRARPAETPRRSPLTQPSRTF